VTDDENGARNLLLGDGIVDDGIKNGETGIGRGLGKCRGNKQESDE
jgi:hypothetical protein